MASVSAIATWPSMNWSKFRTSNIGREHDKETDLGFGACPEALRGSVRLYEPEYGRFLSTDVLWGLYRSVQPYQYSLNQPVSQIDAGGKWVEAKTPQAQEAVRNSVPSCFRDAVTFNKDGILNAGPLVEAAVGQDPESNVARLADIAGHSEGVEILVLNDNDIVDVVRSNDKGQEVVMGYSFGFINAARTDEEGVIAGDTHPGRFLSDAISDKSSMTLFSANENTKVLINARHNAPGETAAHELLHVGRLSKHVASGGKGTWRHQVTSEDPQFKQVEKEASSDCK
jgi:RHS repeat-associated protein